MCVCVLFVKLTRCLGARLGVLNVLVTLVQKKGVHPRFSTITINHLGLAADSNDSHSSRVFVIIWLVRRQLT